jgi:biopolymer transport protein ExbB
MKKPIIARMILGAAAALALALPGVANAWANKDFAYRKAITLDAKAAGVGESLKGFPALVRLDSGQFNFKDVQASGADIRFYDADDKTPLDYQVESFDAGLGLAMIWVRAPELPSGGQHQVWMYYGSAKARDGQAPDRVWDTQYRGVWHFAGVNPGQDATAFHNNASGVSQAPAAAIGQGAGFDGQQAVVLAASDSLKGDPGNGYTIELWAHEAAPQPMSQVYANGALTVGLDNGVPYVDVAGKRAQAASAVNDWVHLAVAGDGAKTVLYVNGQPAATVDAPAPALTGPATLGGAGFKGQMDELRVSATARPAAFIAADYAAQKQGSALVTLGADEKPSGSGFGYFGVIFKNITPDAWVVIGVLLVMAVLSWFVMWAKGTYIGAVTGANRAFDRRFRELGHKDLLALDKQDGAGVTGSPLYRLYRTGVAELHQRGDLKGQALTEETVAAIRASLDAQQVEENQKLDRFMVLLTIAISGGPFIGLLGTVIGVMITFAAIAAAGDVNVNAIAPGIAAALMATVAGLFVAIPALFGYNYLSSRIADISAKMQVFADQFITRLAEVQRNASMRSHAPAE